MPEEASVHLCHTVISGSNIASGLGNNMMYAEFTFCYTRGRNNLTSEWVEVIMACCMLLYQHLLEGTEQCYMRPWVRLAAFWIKNSIWAVLLLTIELWCYFDTLGDCCLLCCVAGPSFFWKDCCICFQYAVYFWHLKNCNGESEFSFQL